MFVVILKYNMYHYTSSKEIVNNHQGVEYFPIVSNDNMYVVFLCFRTMRRRCQRSKFRPQWAKLRRWVDLIL